MTSIAATLLSLALLGNAGEARALEGCWVLARVHSLDAGVEDGEWLGSSFLDKEVVRCLEGGGGVVERRVVSMVTPWGGRYLRRVISGSWAARGGVLRIAWESGDEGEWRVGAFAGGLDVGGELWRRIELDPDQLRAEAGADAAPAPPGSSETEEDGEEQDADPEEVVEDEDEDGEGWDADEGRAEVEPEDVDEEP